MSTVFLTKINIRTVVFFALLVRVIWALFVPISPVSDSVVYDLFAKSIAFKGQYAFPSGDITVFWPVGTSAVYALSYKIFGVSFLPIVMLNIALGVAIVWLTYQICVRYLSQKTALIASIIMALWPIYIEFTTILASELIFTFLILAALYVWGSRINPVLRAIIWGALVCAATYTRPTALPLIVILPAAEWLAKRDLKASMISCCIAAITAAALFAPWMQRNHTQFGHYVMVSANGGVNLWMGNNPESNGGYMPMPEHATQSMNEVERDIYLKKLAVDFIKNNPLAYLKLGVKRALLTYKAETIGIHWNGALEKLNARYLTVLKALSSLYWWVMLAIAFYGFYRLLKDRQLSLFHPVSLVFGYFFVFPLLTVGQDRYHMPINPFLAMFAAYSICLFIEIKRP